MPLWIAAALLQASPLPPLAPSLPASPDTPAAARAYAALPQRPCRRRMIEAAEAVDGAARWARANADLPGCFRLLVRRMGSDGHGDLFLDSEEDYRSMASLNVRIDRTVVPALRRMLGTDDLASALTRRIVLIDGTAVRTLIGFAERGRPTGHAYTQTQVLVAGTGQLARPPVGLP